ncbi:UNVERIFIED_CONTAM: hypothetical protein K2H54_012355 [Gekko kuhli]
MIPQTLTPLSRFLVPWQTLPETVALRDSDLFPHPRVERSGEGLQPCPLLPLVKQPCKHSALATLHLSSFLPSPHSCCFFAHHKIKEIVLSSSPSSGEDSVAKHLRKPGYRYFQSRHTIAMSPPTSPVIWP